jgi:hypothetical protein
VGRLARRVLNTEWGGRKTEITTMATTLDYWFNILDGWGEKLNKKVQELPDGASTAQVAEVEDYFRKVEGKISSDKRALDNEINLISDPQEKDAVKERRSEIVSVINAAKSSLNTKKKQVRPAK